MARPVTLSIVSADKTMASGGEDQTVKLWEAGGGQLLRTLSGHFGAVSSVA
jgi:WD40 repeat protein